LHFILKEAGNRRLTLGNRQRDRSALSRISLFKHTNISIIWFSVLSITPSPRFKSSLSFTYDQTVSYAYYLVQLLLVLIVALWK